MDKRLQKRHRRKVARAKENVKLSEPDVRTPEQIKAAREASRATDAARGGPNMQNSALSFRGPSHATGGAAKTDTSG
jgi:hypothetical protein